MVSSITGNTTYVYRKEIVAEIGTVPYNGSVIYEDVKGEIDEFIFDTVGVGNNLNFTPMYGAQAFTSMMVHDMNYKLLGFLPGYRAPLRKYGLNGTNSWFVYDEEIICGDRIIHTLLHDYISSGDQARRMCLISGEGFRDVI